MHYFVKTGEECSGWLINRRRPGPRFVHQGSFNSGTQFGRYKAKSTRSTTKTCVFSVRDNIPIISVAMQLYLYPIHAYGTR